MRNNNLLGNRLDIFLKSDLHSYITSVIDQKLKVRIFNLNVYAVNISYSNKAFKKVLNDAERIFCDGVGIQLAAYILRMKVPEKITYVDWIWDLAELCSKNKLRVFLLGSDEINIRNTSEKIKTKYPHLELFYHHGYFNKDSQENQSVIDYINSVQPEILIVGFGMPLQEIWITNNLDKIKSNIFLTSGGCFDVLGGKYPRCPAVLQKMGMQWLFRFILEPRRLFKRYIIGNPLFLLRVLLQKLGLQNIQ